MPAQSSTSYFRAPFEALVLKPTMSSLQFRVQRHIFGSGTLLRGVDTIASRQISQSNI
jgi:hypothetical protein